METTIESLILPPEVSDRESLVKYASSASGLRYLVMRPLNPTGDDIELLAKPDTYEWNTDIAHSPFFYQAKKLADILEKGDVENSKIVVRDENEKSINESQIRNILSSLSNTDGNTDEKLIQLHAVNMIACSLGRTWSLLNDKEPLIPIFTELKKLPHKYQGRESVISALLISTILSFTLTPSGVEVLIHSAGIVNELIQILANTSDITSQRYALMQLIYTYREPLEPIGSIYPALLKLLKNCKP